MILELDTHVRKIGALLEEGNWNKATQNMWNETALSVLLNFVHHNKCSKTAKHVVHTVLDEMAQRINNSKNAMNNMFHVEPENTLGAHAIQLLLIPSYTVYYCAIEVERLKSIELQCTV